MQDGRFLGHRRLMLIACFGGLFPLLTCGKSMPAGAEEDCASLFKKPESWKVSPRIGRTLHWSLPSSDLKAIKSDEFHLPVVEKNQADAETEYFLRPGVDVVFMPESGQQCAWSGDMRLSTSSTCSEEKEDGADSDHAVKVYQGESMMARLALGTRCLVAKVSSGSSFAASVCNIQYFFCVKPSKDDAEFVPLHFFWYKRDADGKSARAFFDTRVKDMLEDWVFTDSIVMHKPLAKELVFDECHDARLKEREASGDSQYASGKAKKDDTLRLLHDDCDGLTYKKAEALPPHSAVLLCFRRGKNEGSEATTPDDKGAAMPGQSLAVSSILAASLAILMAVH